MREACAVSEESWWQNLETAVVVSHVPHKSTSRCRLNWHGDRHLPGGQQKTCPR